MGDDTTSARLLRSSVNHSESATGQSECTLSSHVHGTLSDIHSISVHEVGTSTSDLIIQQDVAISVDDMDFPDQADNDDETLPKTIAGDQEEEEQIPFTTGRTTPFQLPQQESTGGADAFVLEEGSPGQETHQKYRSYFSGKNFLNEYLAVYFHILLLTILPFLAAEQAEIRYADYIFIFPD